MSQPEDDYEEQYLKRSAILLERISQRDEMAEILKRAKPHQSAAVREGIAKLDESIEDHERILESLAESRRLREDVEKQEHETLAMGEMMIGELRQHLAENEPEKIELLDALLSDDGKSH